MKYALASRLAIWGRDEHGWDFQMGVDHLSRNPVFARLGPVTGYGVSTNEAINNLADGLIEEGWQDDRPDDVSLSERLGPHATTTSGRSFQPKDGCSSSTEENR